MEPRKFHIEPENDLAKSVRNLRDNMEMYLEMERLLAKVLKTKYDELLKLGFTPSQAIDLCRK